MMETWLPFAIRHPGPLGKTGYSGATGRTLAEIEGEVKHSSEGTLAGALAVLADPNRQASWHLTIAKTGLVYQHYPWEAVTWHAGLPGDRRIDTSLLGNLTLIGEEYEGGGPGKMGEPLTVKQLAASIRVSESVRRLCPRVAANPPTLRRNLWEHNWLSATSCPSGRIPWNAIIAALQEEEMDEITIKRWIQEAVIIHENGIPHVSGEHVANLINDHYGQRPHLTIGQIVENHGPHGAQIVTGYTDAQAVKAVKEAL